MTNRHDHLVHVFPEIAADLMKPLTEVVALGRALCDGDADKLLIMLTVGVRTFEHPAFQRLEPHRLLSGELPCLPSLGTNAGSISASLGIPKETVRRKVLELLERGWLTREDGDLSLAPKAYPALTPLAEAMARLALRYADLVAAALPAD